MYNFIKCPQGHVYESRLKECPYCSGKELDEDLKNLPEKDIEPPETAMCYDMGPSDFKSDYDLDDEEEDDDKDKEVKFPHPIPPSCYAPQPPKYKE